MTLGAGSVGKSDVEVERRLPMAVVGVFTGASTLISRVLSLRMAEEKN